jgi:uncharacterized membrane protein
MIDQRAADPARNSAAAPDLTWQGVVENQRLLSLAFGSGMLLGASSRRSLPVALTGALLLYHGVTGRWALAGLPGRLGIGRRRQARTSVPHESGIKVEHSVTIRKSPEEIYRFWRDLENLPRFMSQHASVQRHSNLRSHWKIASIGGATLEWDAEIINDVPNELLAWRSLEGGDIDHAGSVRFARDGADSTRVTVVMEYRPPAGKLGAGIARLFGQEPAQVLEKDLQRLKEMCESGQIQSAPGQAQGAI